MDALKRPRAAKRGAAEEQAAAAPAKRARAAPAPEIQEAPRAFRSAATSTVAVGGLALPCQTGVPLRLVSALASAAAAAAVASLEFPCPPEHLLSLQQDGCTGEVALLTFATATEAQRAVAALHGCTSVRGYDGTVRLWARQLGGEGALVRRWRLIVRNVAFRATEELLLRTFNTAGFVWDLHIPKAEDGRMRGFAFVSFTARAHAEQAIASLNGTVVAGRAIAVDWALSKKHYDAHARPESEGGDGAVEEAPEEEAPAGEQVDEAALMLHVLSSVVRTEAEPADNDRPARAPVAAATGLSARSTRRLQQASASDKPSSITVFAHNLSPEATAFDIQHALRPLGRVLKCRVVIDKVTGRSKGTAFLEFADQRSATAAIEAAGGESGVLVAGRHMKLASAVTKEEARSMAAGKAGHGSAPQDRRNLLLAREGEILDGSAASVGVSGSDMVKRRRAAQEKVEKLRNPNFSVSRTRLHFRNLPPSLDERALKRMCVEAVVGRLGIRPVVRQARLLHDDSRLDSSGAPRSRGMGFVDLVEHEHALCVLRHLNNNPTVLGKERRPIVEFALEDARAARKHALNVQMRTARSRREEGGHSEVPAPPPSQRRDAGNMARGAARARRT